jgi:HEAT repeat protein
LLAGENEELRWWAVRTLGEIDDPACIPMFRQALRDPAISVRQCAARGLLFHPAAELVPDLVACLGSGDSLLARLSGAALASAGEAAVPELIAVLEHGSQLAKVEAARALAEIKDPRAIPAFFHAVQDGDSPLVEYWSEIGLENLGIGMTFFDPG